MQTLKLSLIILINLHLTLGQFNIYNDVVKASRCDEDKEQEYVEKTMMCIWKAQLQIEADVKAADGDRAKAITAYCKGLTNKVLGNVWFFIA